MNLQTKRATALVSPASDDGSGSFDAILSTPTIDRDGESLASHKWKQPLPSRISITVDHTGSVSDVVASGEPYLAPDGSLRLRGRFSAGQKGQEVRQLVVDGHINALSIEFLRGQKSADGQAVNELTGASFVLLPANTDAVVTSAKSAAFGAAVRYIVKSGGGDDAMLQAIHDASVHLGAGCMDGVDGASDGANKGRGDITDDDGDGDDYDYDEKALRALALRMKALRR